MAKLPIITHRFGEIRIRFNRKPYFAMKINKRKKTLPLKPIPGRSEVERGLLLPGVGHYY